MRRSNLAFGAGGLAIGLVIGAAGLRLLSTDNTGRNDSFPKHTTTVAVQRRSLEVSENTSGELAASAETTLTTIGSGTVTEGAAAGTRLDRGAVIAKVDDRPVMLLIGGQPVWRSFESGMSDGADVGQLEANLAALGIKPRGWTVDNHFDSDTAYAIEMWETSLGVPQPDGVVDAGEVIFAPDAVQVTAGVPAGTRVTPGATLATVRPDTGAGLTLTFTVTEEADRYQPDKRVVIVAADGTKHPATITSFERVASTGGAQNGGGFGGGGQSASFVVTATPAPGDKAMNPGPVEVEIPTQSAVNVLAVPSRALVAVVEGGQAVELADRHRLVAVKVGVFADGWVEVSGAGISEGTKVVAPT